MPDGHEFICIGCSCTDSTPCVNDGRPCSWIRVDRMFGAGICSQCAALVARWDESHHETEDPAVRFADILARVESLGLVLVRCTTETDEGLFLNYVLMPVGFELPDLASGCRIETATMFRPDLDRANLVLHVFASPAEALRMVIGNQEAFLGREMPVVLGDGHDDAGPRALLLQDNAMFGPMFAVVDHRTSPIILR